MYGSVSKDTINQDSVFFYFLQIFYKKNII